MSKLVVNILRIVCAFIDSIMVKMLTVLYRLLSNLSELVLYSDNIIKLIGRRIGLILGIFMLFKLAISLINYMISPDKISDKAKGGGRLIINVGISLALLISINFIFKEAYNVQGIIVNSNIIEKIFFGERGYIKNNNNYSSNQNSSTSSNPPTAKMDIGYYLYSAFFVPSEDVFGDVCDDMWDVSSDWNEVKAGQTKSCYKSLESNLNSEEMKSLGNARNSMDMTYVLKDHDLINEYNDRNRSYYFNYTPIVSTAAGFVVLLVLLSFSMDLATRAVKLLFLQIIAPIPIISNIDMGKGQDIFKKWGKECINTYLSVFIRLIAINFAVFMIVLLKGDYKSLFTNDIWLNIFLIIGCLMFAKQVPKLLEDFLGIKMDGMSLHPLKKFEEQALFGKNITGAISGTAIGGIGNAVSLLQEGKGFAAIPGVFTGASRGLTHGLIEGKGLKDQAKRQAEMNQKIRQARLDETYFLGRRLDSAASFFGAETPSERYERMSKSAESKLNFNQTNLDYVKNMRDYVLDDLRHKSVADMQAIDKNGPAIWKTAKEQLLQADAALINAQNGGSYKGLNGEAAIAQAQADLSAAEDAIFANVLDNGNESARMKADREKFLVRAENNAALIGDAELTQTLEKVKESKKLTKEYWDSIKGKSQGKVNEYESEVYRHRNSTQASRYQANRTYNDTTSFK